MAVVQAENDASVVTALYLRTRALHLEAERTGIVAEILRGTATRDGYTLLLRNLHPAYRAIEAGIARHRDNPILAPLAAHSLARTPAIEADLVALAGTGWNDQLPVLPAAEAYADRIAEASEGDGSRLIAHAYTRYLGDLNGGQIVRRLLEKTMQLGPAELAHYDFSAIGDPGALKTEYREALEQAGAAAPDAAAIIEEGAAAFTCNIALSVAVQQHLADRAVTV
ncbi:biliverdin-producing heme oxygenase [Rhodopseudomonas sp. WA056]|uniref:biliverdin-producing heme oxygenase n=1 Tax=Rhodopseudomonas TaxID=1073 RepID=UPI00115C4D33|nr:MULTISPECIES: biliverdin-producing heme oxygenase [Rhodopseudomonas]NEW86528.1 biliverdin-producing heme oxygenase [Rhodopseudomonas sp. WA056]QDL96442.1 biliverdin-producing heme oxygenase [Rhodopseudomonas palustris]